MFIHHLNAYEKVFQASAKLSEPSFPCQKLISEVERTSYFTNPEATVQFIALFSCSIQQTSASFIRCFEFLCFGILGHILDTYWVQNFSLVLDSSRIQLSASRIQLSHLLCIKKRKWECNFI